MGKEERFNYYINKKDDKDWFIDDRVKEEEITIFKDVVQLLNQQDQRIAELEEQLKKSLESNNDFLKQIMELETQLIKERLKGENNV